MRIALAPADNCGWEHDGPIRARPKANAIGEKKAQEWRDSWSALTETTNLRILLAETRCGETKMGMIAEECISG